jgi:hypothetical protein
VARRWLSTGTQISSTNKADRHDITEILLKVALNTITLSWIRTHNFIGDRYWSGAAQLKKLRRAEGGAKMFGVFRVKNHDFTPKNRIFSNFRGVACAGCARPPGSAPPARHDITEILLKVALNTITLTILILFIAFPFLHTECIHVIKSI